MLPPALLIVLAAGWLSVGVATSAAAPARPPNIVIVLADDLGYGDLSCYGAPSLRTPHLDRLASEGLRFTSFYAPAEKCTPSRAGLLTGRYAIRSGMSHVLYQASPGGLPSSEITIATALKRRGYATAHIGKWHLGVVPGTRPNDHGFDLSLGVPYSNDMDPSEKIAGTKAYASPDPPLDGWLFPLLRNGQVVEQPVDQRTLTRRYTEEAVDFIEKNKSESFFLYFAHTFPHVPLFASEKFRGRSPRGLYGDTVEEMDWSVGQIVAALRQAGVAENTLVVFTSDNGPSLIMGLQGGSAGPLRGGKGTTWEGGLRVPAIAWWPGRIAPAVTGSPANALDLYSTCLTLAGAEVPSDRVVDGIDLSPLLFAQKPLPERPYFYYSRERLNACRLGRYKLHLHVQPQSDMPDAPPLYDLEQDPGESFNIAAEHPAIVQEIHAAIAAHRAALVPGKPQLPLPAPPRPAPRK